MEEILQNDDKKNLLNELLEQKKETNLPVKNKTKRQDIFAALYNGAGIGILLGMLMGLAISPVVSAMIGTLSSILAVLLGLNDKYVGYVKSLRIGSFGFFMVAGILIGMYTRTHNLMSPDLNDMKQEYIDAGFTKEEALDFVAYIKLGMTSSDEPIEENTSENENEPEVSVSLDEIPEGEIKKSTKEKKRKTKRYNPVKENNLSNQQASVLFASVVNLDDCYTLSMADESMSLQDILDNFKATGGTWAKLAKTISTKVPSSERKNVLLALRDAFCGIGEDGMLKIVNCKKLSNLSEMSDLSTIKTQMFEAGNVWKQIFNAITQRVSKENRKKSILVIIETLCKK